MGEALVKNHITMNMNIQEKDQIYTVTEGGKNWYETEHTFELILDEKEDLEFTLQPMDGEKPFVHTMKLKDFRTVQRRRPDYGYRRFMSRQIAV